MGCSNCANGGSGKLPGGCKNNGACGISGCNKMEVFDWLAGMERVNSSEPELIEVRFKSTRKEYYRNSENLPLGIGNVVVVESQTGHDIGTVTLSGELVKLQMRKKNIHAGGRDMRRIYRIADQKDIDLWQEAQGLERETVVKTRQIVRELNLDMKISDVEYQADKSKATFYYIAEDRVDFRALIKVLADRFRVRVEMRQIGARQEAGRVGGIGSCGRELCCSTWLTDFRTVSTTAARYQQLAINPIKLAGQCGKLKCCLNFELDSYMDALSDFPKQRPKLKTAKGTAFHQKSDIFKRIMWYSYEDAPTEFIPLEVDRVKEILAMNESGKKAEDLKTYSIVLAAPVEENESFGDVVGQESLTRFDKSKSKNKSRSKGKSRGKGQGQKPGGGPKKAETQGKSQPKAQSQGESKSQPRKKRRPPRGNKNSNGTNNPEK